MKFLKPVFAICVGVLGASSGAVASESLSYRCNTGNQFVFVQTIPEEGRAVYEELGTKTDLVPDGRGGYFNEGSGISFQTDKGEPLVWLGDVSHRCELARAGTGGRQTHAGGAVGGNETQVNAQGRSLGGKLRDGPGTNFRQLGSLSEGTWVTILTNTGVRFDGYDWFEVAADSGQRGYQWGGIMCSNGQHLAGIYQQCGTSRPAQVQPTAGNPRDLNVQGRSLGGKLRGGPGTNHAQVGSLPEGSWITILRNSGVRMDGYDWFEVVADNGKRGFQWGGIMCSNGRQIAGIYQVCGTAVSGAPAPGSSNGQGGGWMAFALAPGGAFGHGAAPTRAGAEQFAMQYCGSRQCTIADATQARCHALAVSPSGNGIGAGDSEQAARDFAISWCANNGASGCRLEYAYCQ